MAYDPDLKDDEPLAPKKMGADDELDAIRQGEASAEETQTDGTSGEGREASKDDDGDDDGGWFSSKAEKGEKGLRSFFQKRKKAFATGLIISALGGGILGGTISQGPLQFIHFSQLLQGAHLQDEGDESDDRWSRIARYIREPDKPENTRMGVLGNLMADRVEKRFNKSGVESAYTRLFGFLDGYIIDPDKLSDDFAEANGKSDEEVKSFFQERYGVTLESRPDGKLFASSVGMGYFQQRKLIKSVVTTSGYGRTMGAISARLMGKRAGVDWHPIRRLDDALLKSIDQRYTEWKKRREANIQNGADTSISADNKANPDDETAHESAHQVADATTEILEEASGTDAGDAAATEKLDKSLRTKLGIGAGAGAIGGSGLLAAAGILCSMQALSANYDQVKAATVIKPLIRMGMSTVAMGDQSEDGKDNDLEQMGFVAEDLYDEETDTSWNDAQSIRANSGQQPSSVTDPPEVRIDAGGNALTKLLKAVPGLGAICAVEDNALVQGGGFIISFLGGPLTALSGAGVGAVFNSYLPDIIKWLVGQPIETFPKGAKLGSYVDYGVKYARDDIGASMGGVPLTTEESTELLQTTTNYAQAEFQSKSLAYRLFNPYDYRTLTARLIDTQQVDPNNTMAAIGRNLVSVIKLPGSVLSQVFFKRAHAVVTPFDYGSPIIGTSISNMNNPAVAQPFANGTRVVTKILKGPRGPELIKRAEVCNGMIIHPEDGLITSAPDVASFSERLAPENKCNEKSDDWLRVRFYIKDMILLESGACREGNADSCTNIGFDTGALTTDPDAPAEDAAP